MEKKQKIIVGVFVSLLVIVNIAVFSTLFFPDALKTMLVDEEVNLTDEEILQNIAKDAEGQKKGWVHMLEGKIVDKSKKKLAIEVSDGINGEISKYEILLAVNVKVFEKRSWIEGGGEDEGGRVVEEKKEVSVDSVLPGQVVSVFFPDRVDVKSAEKLVAHKVFIYLNMNENSDE